MEFDSVVDKRKSIRSFKDKRVKWKDIMDAIDCSIQGPFAEGINNLNFLIIEEPDKIEKIAEFASQTWINEASALVVVCSDDAALENLHGERGRVYSRQQAGAAIQTFLLKLVDIGLSGCWVGSYTDELIKQYLKIPSHIQIEAIVPMGYESGKSAKKKKKNLEHSIYWEKWGERKRPSLIQEGEDKFNLREYS